MILLNRHPLGRPRYEEYWRDKLCVALSCLLPFNALQSGCGDWSLRFVLGDFLFQRVFVYIACLLGIVTILSLIMLGRALLFKRLSLIVCD